LQTKNKELESLIRQLELKNVELRKELRSARLEWVHFKSVDKPVITDCVHSAQTG